MIFDRLFKSEHQRVEEMLSAYIDGELSPTERALVEKHLAQCADCTQNLRTLRQTVALLGELSPVVAPRAFTIRPVEPAPSPSFFQTRRAYDFLRAATAVAAILFAVVLAGDVFVSGPFPDLAPARAPEVVVREAPVEKLVAETVVLEKEVVVEKEVEKEAVVEAPSEAPLAESERVYAATPSPAPSAGKGEPKRVPQPSPLPTVAEEIEAEAPSALMLSTPEWGAQAEGPQAAREDWAEATAMPTPQPAEAVGPVEPASTPTAVAEVVPSTPLPLPTAAPPAARSGRSESALWRVAEIGLLSLVLILAVATLAARRRQHIG